MKRMKTQKISMTRLALAATVSLLAAGLSPIALAQDQTRYQTRDQLKDQTGDKTQDKTQDRTRDQDRLQDPIYGSQLMTQQERTEYQNRMRALKTEKEREAYRLEHHQKMQERARIKGVTLPETPPIPRPGMGTGPGPGTGAGPGPGPGAGPGPGPGANTGTSAGPGSGTKK